MAQFSGLFNTLLERTVQELERTVETGHEGLDRRIQVMDRWSFPDRFLTDNSLSQQYGTCERARMGPMDHGRQQQLEGYLSR